MLISTRDYVLFLQRHQLTCKEYVILYSYLTNDVIGLESLLDENDLVNGFALSQTAGRLIDRGLLNITITTPDSNKMHNLVLTTEGKYLFVDIALDPKYLYESAVEMGFKTTKRKSLWGPKITYDLPTFRMALIQLVGRHPEMWAHVREAIHQKANVKKYGSIERFMRAQPWLNPSRNS